MIVMDLMGDMRGIDPTQIEREGGPITSRQDSLPAGTLTLKSTPGSAAKDVAVKPASRGIPSDADIKAIEKSLGTTDPTTVIDELRKQNFRLN
jgi:hypothetical protein